MRNNTRQYSQSKVLDSELAVTAVGEIVNVNRNYGLWRFNEALCWLVVMKSVIASENRSMHAGVAVALCRQRL